MPYYVSSKTNDQFLAFLTFVFVLLSYLLATSVSGSLFLVAVTVLFLVLSNFKFEAQPFHLFVLQFCLYCYATSMWAYNYHTAISNGNTIFELLVCLSIMYCHFKKFNDVTQLMKIIMWAGYVVVLYSYAYYGLERIMSVDEGRLGNSSFNNINVLSQLAATVVIINVYFIVVTKKLSWTILLMVPSLIFVISSQSRKSVAIVILGLTLLALMKFLRSRKDNLLPIIRFLAIILVIGTAMLFLSSTSMMESFMERMSGMISAYFGDGETEIDASTKIRIQLKELGWNQFRETPWFGMGMGCAQFLVARETGDMAYLHDNYAELAANGGIFGLISFYIIYVYLLVNEWKYYKVDKMSNLVLTLIIIRFIIDWGAVSYYSKITYFQMMVYFLHLESCRTKYPEVAKEKRSLFTKKKKNKIKNRT